MRILITGGAGFIGSAAVRYAIGAGYEVVNVDALTYAGDLSTVASVAGAPSYSFCQIDINERAAVRETLSAFVPDVILHFAAETHVDRSIDSPTDFVATNVVGTSNLLAAALEHYEQMPALEKSRFRFVHISTDEVYGSLGETGYFDESCSYDPSSPYSASKAAADHLCKAWYRTYELPVIVTNCSNNFGPFQHPEKLIPTVVRSALEGADIPVYGSGTNVRDWLFVDDHISAIFQILNKGDPGETYCIGGNCEKSNIEIVGEICEILDKNYSNARKGSYRNQIAMVKDRPGHDFRYAIDNSKLVRATGWQSSKPFSERLQETVAWFVNNPEWLSKSLGRLGLRR